MASFQNWITETEGTQWTLEFVGGPLDGYTYIASFPFEELVETMAMPVNPNVVRMLGGEHTRRKSPATSVAIYELKKHADNWRYEHVGAASAEQFQLQTWLG